jgi:hypothetical protein
MNQPVQLHEQAVRVRRSSMPNVGRSASMMRSS